MCSSGSRSSSLPAGRVAGAVERQLTQYMSTMSQQMEATKQAAEKAREDMRADFTKQIDALTARLDTGEANIGAAYPLDSIAACVIAGVSLRGGVGRVENVVLGALFIVLVQNGMNLARIESYLQVVVTGVLLILAVIADQIRLRTIAVSKD